jgi:hypothetical protein
LVATAGLLRVGLFRDESISGQRATSDINPSDEIRQAPEKPVVYLKTPIAAESDGGEVSSQPPLRDGTLRRGAAS